MKRITKIFHLIKSKLKSTNSLILILIFIFLLLATFLIVKQQQEKQITKSRAQNASQIGVEHMSEQALTALGLRKNKDGPCKELLEVLDKDMKIKGCTHGPDPAPEGIDVTKSVEPLTTENIEPSTASGEATLAATTVTCDGDGVSGYRTQVVYVRASDKPDRYSQFAASFPQYAQIADGVFSQSAAQTGGTRHIRFVTDSACNLVVKRAVVSPTGDDTFGNLINELQTLQENDQYIYNMPNRKYLLWTDTTKWVNGVSFCGIGHIWPDDTLTETNYNNTATFYGATGSGCWGGYVEAHELMHNLGGVQMSAPHTSRGWHCTDEYDRMCYPDSPYYPQMTIRCSSTTEDKHFDCGKDDYFHTNPPAGNYLKTHWNTANNRFLIGATPFSTAEPKTPDPDPQPVTVTNGLYSLINSNSSKVLDVAGAGTTDGTNVQIWTENGGVSQRWQITQNTDGTYKLINPNSGKALNVEGAGTADEANVQIWTDDGSLGQKWQFYQNTDGTYKLINPNSDKALNVYHGLTADGTNVEIYQNYSGSSQKWQLKPIIVKKNYLAIADTYVSSSNPSSIYGSTSSLSVRGNPDMRAYLKFDLRDPILTGKNIIKIELKIGTTSESSLAKQDIRLVSNTSWTESATKYSSKPATGTMIGQINSGGKKGWMYTDITSGIKPKVGQLVSLALTQTSTDLIKFNSRETPYDPVLIITYQ